MFALVGHERDHVTYDSLRAVLGRARGHNTTVLDLIVAALAGDRSRAEAALAALDADQPPGSLHYPKVVAEDGGDYELAERAARNQTRAENPPSIRAAGHLNLADLFVAQGRWRAASGEIDRAAAIDAARARRSRASLATLPFLPVPREDLLLSLQEMREWQPAPAEPGSPPERAYDQHVRQYLLGLLWSGIGDPAAALAHADTILTLEDAAGTAVPNELATIVRADVEWRRGADPESVLRALQPLRGHVPAVFWNDPVLAQEHARWVRVAALIGAGRHDEALRWLRNTFVVTPGWVYNRGPAAYLEARALDGLGRAGEAAEARRVYRRLWTDAEVRFPN